MPRNPHAKPRQLSDDEYASRLAAQGGTCALCPATPKTRKLDTDHDHKTGVIRGLLCHWCNRRLGQRSSPEWLRAAADYLEGSTNADS